MLVPGRVEEAEVYQGLAATKGLGSEESAPYRSLLRFPGHSGTLGRDTMGTRLPHPYPTQSNFRGTIDRSDGRSR